ncbi:hypothetical protein LS45_24635 [Klebsiella pneumoniae]|uniref:Secreted protein n=1 Tax=Klebsiella pneumoniae TaxID=573 RepID=A0AAW3FTY5_KLEPN|nr:hypothetical protein LS45_24635 [Klebsiella pneumoniae]
MQLSLTFFLFFTDGTFFLTTIFNDSRELFQHIFQRCQICFTSMCAKCTNIVQCLESFTHSMLSGVLKLVFRRLIDMVLLNIQQHISQ